jgi:hypothetical protein
LLSEQLVHIPTYQYKTHMNMLCSLGVRKKVSTFAEHTAMTKIVSTHVLITVGDRRAKVLGDRPASDRLFVISSRDMSAPIRSAV